ncbi:hypothetical protein OHB01_15290 [Microbispora hainanensis]|jgi:hypothetical protein|uniref:DUF4352 domain-containing protein n=1 Tax=Microbispora hainanensis TaxID=568844 RepID=A0ABZ1SH74_9ACTN|nr:MULTISPECIES: hypothetical protein [Microbispora]NJP29169.1 hypothetical protein [Microbispora sp. CL1-1]TQS06105.1 hypothetical protein FLW53_34210 [Microbispora sp. SCL1-1]
MTSSPNGARRRRPVLVPVATALAVVGIGVTAALGGFEEAPEKPPPTVSPGDVIDQGQFHTQFIKAIDTTEKGDFDTERRYLELVLKVTNMGTETASVGVMPEPGKGFHQSTTFASSLLRTRPEIKTKYGPDVAVLSLGVESHQLQPGITTTVVVKYELEPTAIAPSEISLDVGSFAYETVGMRDQTHYWFLVGENEDGEGDFEPDVAARITLPVRKEST